MDVALRFDLINGDYDDTLIADQPLL